MALPKRVSRPFKLRLQVIQFVDDCKKIRDALLAHGLEVTILEAQELWAEASAMSFCAWIPVDSGEKTRLCSVEDRSFGPVRPDLSNSDWIVHVLSDFIETLPFK